MKTIYQLAREAMDVEIDYMLEQVKLKTRPGRLKRKPARSKSQQNQSHN